MLTRDGQRKTIHHFEDNLHAHELTFCCVHRLPVLASDTRCVLLAQSISRAFSRHPFDLLAFVFMPDHVHLIALPEHPGASVAALLFAIKRPFAHRVNESMERTHDPLLPRLRTRGAFHVWQQGPGYDRNITSRDTLRSSIRYIHRNPVRRGLCDRPSAFHWSSWSQWHDPQAPPDPSLPPIRRIPCH